MQRNKFFFACCLLCAVVLAFSTCKEENMETNYKGMVVNLVNNQPFPNLEVKVTDGKHINTTVHTDETGFFSILVKYNEINSSYYILIGDTSCVPVKREFKGFGKPEIDLGTIEVEGPKAPMVITASVSEIAAEYAVCGGNVTDDGRATITARGVCWSKEEYPTISDTHTSNGTGKGEFQSQLSNLECGNTYFVRAYATNRMGTVYGEQKTFTTNTGLPIVTTDTIHEIRALSAIGGGSIEANGYIVTGCGLCWSNITTTPTIDDDHTNEIVKESFIGTMGNLNRNTTYYCRAYATNKNGVSYGETVIFTTMSGLPTIITMDVSSFTETTAETGGKITDDGDFRITERGVCWSLSSQPTIYDYTTSDGKGVGSFSSTITDIDLTNESNTYYIRAYATNEAGTAYGNEVIISYQHYKYIQLPKIEYNSYIYTLLDDIGEAPWERAMSICENLEYGGYNDWSLPTRDELKFIMNHYFDGWLDEDGKPFTCISYENRVITVDSDGHDQDGNKIIMNGNDHYWCIDSPRDNAYYNGRYLSTFHYISNGYYEMWHDCYFTGLQKSYSARIRPIRKDKKEY